LARLEQADNDLDDDSSAIESFVTGDSFAASIRFAQPKRTHTIARADTADDVNAYRHGVPVPHNERGLLAQSLQVQVRGAATMPPTAQPQQPLSVSALSVLGGMLDAQPKELSRADKSRLSRHGFLDVIADSATSGLEPSAAVHVAGSISRGQDAVDVQLELRDTLSLHDITFQFAAYKPNIAHTSSVVPRNVYMTYQFYNCRPTRTETMSLLPADPGQPSVLVRADGGSRHDPPLAYKYSIDTSSMSPFEGMQFVKYLASKTLYIDVWDADSLQLLGAVAVPLRMLMRQGKPVVKQGVECAVISPSEQLNQEAILVRDGSCIVGDTIASLQLIMVNYGERGANRWMLQEKLRENLGESSFRGDVHRDGADQAASSHWRLSRLQGATEPESGAGKRPRHRVRARQLSDGVKELAQVRRSDLGYKPALSSPMVRLQTKPSDDRRCLSYADVAMLAKRFRGPVKGTVQYQGAFLKLLDVPSKAKAERKFKRFLRSLHKQNKSMTEYVNRLDASQGQASVANCVEAFREAGAEKMLKDGEIRMILRKFSNKSDGFVDLQALKQHCAPSAPKFLPTDAARTAEDRIVKKVMQRPLSQLSAVVAAHVAGIGGVCAAENNRL
jgi:hypothetical protein